MRKLQPRNAARAPQIERAYCSLKDLMLLKLHADAWALPSLKKTERIQSGQHRSSFRGRGMEFAEVRVYQPGDDIRSIDWRVTARRQKPHTKLFHEERERPVFVLCDQSMPMFFGSQGCFKSVIAAEIAALFTWMALAQGDRAGGIVFSSVGHHPVKPARSRRTALAFLRLLSEYNQALNPTAATGTMTLNIALGELIRLSKHGAMICMISDFSQATPETDKLIHNLARHNELVVFQISDPLEKTLPPQGLYPISNGREVTWLNTQGATLRSQYQAQIQQRDAHLKSICQSNKTTLIPVTTGDSPVHILQQFMAATN